MLIQAVRLSRNMPHPSSVDNRQYTVEHVRAEGEGQGIVMRFRIQRIRSEQGTFAYPYNKCLLQWFASQYREYQ